MTLYGVERPAAEDFGPGTQIVRIDPGSGLTTRVGVPLPAAVHAIASMPPGSSTHATPGTVLQVVVESDPEDDAIFRIEVQDLATPLDVASALQWIPPSWIAAGSVVGD